MDAGQRAVGSYGVSPARLHSPSGRSRYPASLPDIPSPRPSKQGTSSQLAAYSKQSAVVEMMLRSTSVKKKTHGKDLVESGNAMVAEVTAFLAQRAKQRGNDTMRYLELRMKMKPPAPMTMEELEQHPLAKQKQSKRSKQDRDFETGNEEDEEETLPFIPKPVIDKEVVKKLRSEIRNVTQDLHASMKSRPPSLSPRPPTSGSDVANTRFGFSGSWRNNGKNWEEIDWKPSTADSHNAKTARPRLEGEMPKLDRELSPPLAGGNGAVAFLTSCEIPSAPPSRQMVTTQRLSSPTSALSASPLSVRSLGPEHDKQILSRDPKELKKIRNEDRHAQFYRGNVVEEPLPAKVNPEVGGTEEMKLFHQKLHIRDHFFNVASLREIERARAAQGIFRQTKVETLEKFLDDDKLLFATAQKIFGKARSATNAVAREKDNGERLDVFFDHLDRLERFTTPSFPGYALPLLHNCIEESRKAVSAKEGMQEFADFEHIVESCVPPEMMMHYYVADFLKMLVSIFGVGPDKFRAWIREMLKRYDARDYEPVFRSIEISMGKEVTKEARFKIHVAMVRGSLPAVTRCDASLRILVERHVAETAIMPGGAKVTWNEGFTFHVYDEQSPITLLLIQDEETIGQGAFSIFRYPVGKPSKMWFPIPGPLIPHAEVNIVVEVLPLVAKEEFKKTNQSTGGSSPRDEKKDSPPPTE